MKSILFSLLFASLFFSIIFSSCQPAHYIPNMNNVPILQRKGEGSISLGASTAGRDSASQYSLHTSYLFTNHFAIKTNSVIYLFREDFRKNRTRNSGQIHELGLGYVVNLEENLFNLSIWGIIGGGKMNTVLPIQNKQLSTNLFILGINPTASVVTNYYSASFSMKSFYMKYNDIQGNLDYNGTNEVQYLQNNNKAFIVEPTFTQQIGIKRLKFITQMTTSGNLKSRNREPQNTATTIIESIEKSHDRQANFLFSFGLIYNFHTRKREIPTDF